MLIFLLIVLLIVLLIIAFSYTLFYVGVCRFPRDPEAKVPPKMSAYAETINAGMSWFKAQNPQRVEMPAYDGTRLVGLYLEHENPKGTVLMVHGFRSSAYYDFSCAFQYYFEQGYSLLTVFQRAHGESGGSYICYGVKERYDCRDWANYIYDRFGPEHDIFISGVSMGSSTVLMAAGLELPPSVRGIIADCGYTSPYEEFKEVLKRKHIPLHPFIDIAELFSRLMAGFSFRECSTIDAMKACRVPVLFVHGEADTFVPAHFTQENFDACRAEKELLLVPGAAHGASYLVDTERCQTALRDFLWGHSSLSAHEAHPGISDVFQTESSGHPKGEAPAAD